MPRMLNLLEGAMRATDLISYYRQQAEEKPA